jgi:hypothetical protein
MKQIKSFGQQKLDKLLHDRLIYDQCGKSNSIKFCILMFLFSAIKWTYNLEDISKTCHASIYLLISTDGTLTWSILHRLDLSMKNITTLNATIDESVELMKYHIGQFRWFQPLNSKCNNFTWGLSKIISSKFENLLFCILIFCFYSSKINQYLFFNRLFLYYIIISC